VAPRHGSVGPEPEGPGGPLRVGAERRQQIIDLAQRDAPGEPGGGDPVAVQSPREIAQQRIAGIGGHAGNDQLMARDPDGQGLARLEQGLQAGDEALRRLLEVGMAGGIHRALVEDDRELDQEIR